MDKNSIHNSIHRTRGRFIALEGIDGAGKSTQLKRLSQRLSALGVRCYETREPTDSPIGSLVHQIMTGRIEADNRVIASLCAADRVDHLLNRTDGIAQKLDDGITVLTDRYCFSSYAYQGVDMDLDWVIEANRLSAEIVRPTLTVFLDIPVSTALERLARGRFHAELFEKEERLRRVREKYFEAFERLRDEERVVVVDADADEDEVSGRIWHAVGDIFSCMPE